MGLSRFFASRRRQQERTLLQLVAAINDQRYDNLTALVTDSVTIVDTKGGRIEGRDKFIEQDRAYREALGGPGLILESMFAARGEVFARGRLDSDNSHINGPTLWRVGFDDDRVDRIEITRSGGQPTVASFASSRS